MSGPEAERAARLEGLLAEAWKRMGATDAQARVFAGQLLKRAGQLAREEGIPEEEALGRLLAKVARARQGIDPNGP